MMIEFLPRSLVANLQNSAFLIVFALDFPVSFKVESFSDADLDDIRLCHYCDVIFTTTVAFLSMSEAHMWIITIL